MSLPFVAYFKLGNFSCFVTFKWTLLMSFLLITSLSFGGEGRRGDHLCADAQPHLSIQVRSRQ